MSNQLQSMHDETQDTCKPGVYSLATFLLSCASLPRGEQSQEAEQASSQDDDAKGSKGFGFVNFETPEDAKAAVDALNGTDVEGKELFCGRAQKKSEREAALKQKCVFSSACEMLACCK